MKIDVKNVDKMGFVPHHVNMQLSSEEGQALKSLMNQLDADGARLKSGRRVQSHVDCVRWILQGIYLEISGERAKSEKVSRKD